MKLLVTPPDRFCKGGIKKVGAAWVLCLEFRSDLCVPGKVFGSSPLFVEPVGWPLLITAHKKT